MVTVRLSTILAFAGVAIGGATNGWGSNEVTKDFCLSKGSASRWGRVLGFLPRGKSVDGRLANNPLRLPFRGTPAENTISDGEVKRGHLDTAAFPGVSTCIPIVLYNPQTNRIAASIHALADRRVLQTLAKEIATAQKSGPLRVEYLERTLPAKGRRNELLEWLGSAFARRDRVEVLSWLAKEVPLLGIDVRRTPALATTGTEHFAFCSSDGCFARVEPN